MARTLFSSAVLIAVAGSLSGCAEARFVPSDPMQPTRIVAVPMKNVWFPTDYPSVALKYIREHDSNFREEDIVFKGEAAVGQQVRYGQDGKPISEPTSTSNEKEYRVVYRVTKRLPDQTVSTSVLPAGTTRNPNGSMMNSNVVPAGGSQGSMMPPTGQQYPPNLDPRTNQPPMNSYPNNFGNPNGMGNSR